MRVKRATVVLKHAELTAGVYAPSIPIEERRERQGAAEVLATRLKLANATRGKYNLSRPLASGTGALALSSKEQRMRAKAAVKLKLIVEEAGAASELLEQVKVVGDAAGTLLDSVLGMGAHRTITRHVNTWNRFAMWFKAHPTVTAGWKLYPPDADAVLAVVNSLVNSGCGPTVPGLVKESVKWICTRLMMEAPGLDAPLFQALEAEAIARCTKLVRDAVLSL